MREIYYNSNVTEESVNEIKLLTLYYDKINVVNDAVYSPKIELTHGQKKITTEKIEFIPPTFKTDFKLLIDENLISITERNENEDDEFGQRFAKKISNLINDNLDVIFPKHPTDKDARIITEEVYWIMKNMYGFKPGQPVERDFVWFYYAFKLKWFLKLLMEGKNCLTSSNNLNTLFSKFTQNSIKSNENLGIKGHTKSFALDALTINLPNPDLLSFEDILELKLKLRDELGSFHQTINSIEFRNKQLFDSEFNEEEYKTVFYSEVQKPLKDLESKIRNLSGSTFRKFIERMQNPLSYSPLIGTVVASIPLNYSVLASLALTSGVSYMEYKEEKREITNNGLYFLLKLKQSQY